MIDKLNNLKIEELRNIYSIFRLKSNAKKKPDIIGNILESLSMNRWSNRGATGLQDIDVILENEFYKGDKWKALSHISTSLFIKARDRREGK